MVPVGSRGGGGNRDDGNRSRWWRRVEVVVVMAMVQSFYRTQLQKNFKSTILGTTCINI